MKIQISDVMKSALHARCGERYIVQERGEIDIYVSLGEFSLILMSGPVWSSSLLSHKGDNHSYYSYTGQINMPSGGYTGTDRVAIGTTSVCLGLHRVMSLVPG